jgi:hypothetical protein
MPKIHGSTVMASIVFAVLLLIAYHFTLGRR